MNTLHRRALDYIRNSGGSPKIEHFDEDHEPVGPALRKSLRDADLTFERDGEVHLTPWKWLSETA